MDPHVAGRTARRLEPLHAMGYFAPEVEAEVTATGVRRGRSAYFAARAAPMGAVGAGVVTATFYVFSPSLVSHLMPAVWAHATPADVVAARYRGVRAALHRLLGEDAGGDEVAEAAGLARTAASACTPHGRPLHAAHADLPWPQEPLLVLFHALTLLREHRGDGHVAALQVAGLSGLDALVTHTATGRGFTRAAAQATRGWSDEEWAGAETSLVDRGLLTADGSLTDAGAEQRRRVEHETDRLAAGPWEALGPDGVTRLSQLGAPLVHRALRAGAFPDGVFA